MNTNTGEIITLNEEEARELVRVDNNQKTGTATVRRKRSSSVDMGAMKPIDPANLTPRARRQLERSGRTMVSRNSPCPCGSRKRFKRCCMTT